jgi:hypothetical protein
LERNLNLMLERYQTKAEFVEKFSLDDTLKTICFSCGDISTSKNGIVYWNYYGCDCRQKKK